MGKPDAPEAPDPIATGQAQTGVNVTTAIANQIGNMVGQNTPYGSLAYNQTGSFNFTDPVSGKVYNIPRFTAETSLSPDGKVILGNTLDAQKNMSGTVADQTGRLRDVMSNPFSVAGLPRRGPMPTMQQVGQGGPIRSSYQVGDSRRYEKALMDRMAPSMEQSRSARMNELRQQGLTPGSAAFDRAMAQVGTQENDARMAAILNAGQEQSRIAGLNQQQAAFQNAAQQQGFAQGLAGTTANNAALQQNWQNANAFRGDVLQERAGIRNQNINEIQALMGGSQVQSPQFVNTPGLNMPTTDYAGLTQQGFANDMGVYQQRMGAWNGLWGGLLGAGGKILSGGVM